ncbi:family 20 glycosylhydrolase [Kitasatospora purpeofusca]|uniref:family 20 glycosylhydrolase n=1 Tax=Kitasatospora purpeofusca TaxID=67352 RepID=UPI0038600BC7
MADGTEWTLAPVTVEDRPRYAYRGAMLDVARHFFTPAEVKGFVDRLALYKLNHLHLHLTDDQGWRIEVPARPALTAVGATSEVGGTPGELDLMLLPRLPALAELGWSPRESHDWGRFKGRLAEEGARWEAVGFAYERRPEVPWPAR